jgi:hypothetical protein
MKNKTAQIVLITILASLLFHSIAQACSLLEPTIRVKCSNLETPILAYISRADSETLEDFQRRIVEATIQNLHEVIPDCKEDLIPVLDAFEQEIAQWVAFKNRRILLDRDLILEPYSIERKSEIQKNKSNLLTCRYEVSKQVGNWLIVSKMGRPYCYTFWYTTGGMCPVVVLSLGHFLYYLVSNVSLASLPYLVGLLLAVGTITYAWWRVLQNQPAIKPWKIISLSAVILIIELFLIVMPFWIQGQIIGWILLFFLLVLWYKQLKDKKAASRLNAG